MKRFLMRHICLTILFLTVGIGYSQDTQICENKDFASAKNDTYLTVDHSTGNVLESICQSIDLLRNLSCESPKPGNRTSQITKNKEKDLLILEKHYSLQRDFHYNQKDSKFAIKKFEDVLAARHLNGFYIYSLEKLII